MANDKKVLLYSGGLDSWLIDKIWKPDVKLYVNINGEYNKAEMELLPDDVTVIDFPLLGKYEDPDTHFVPLRNLYFLMLGTHYGDNVCFGATKGDRRRKDKTPEFINKTEDLLRYTMGKQRGIFEDSKITIEKRFADMYKHELIQEYLNMGGKIEDVIEKTFSCYSPVNNKECGACRSCFKKYAEGLYFGYKFSDEYELKMYNYIKDNLVPKSKNGGHSFFQYRGAEGHVWKLACDYLYKKYNGNYKEDLNK